MKKNVLPAERLLDIGCGFGCYHLDEIAKEVVGVDISREYLHLASHNGLAAIQSSAESLAFRDGVFDAVTCIETIEHIPDDEKAIREIWRVLRPGGTLAITGPNSIFPSETHVMGGKGEKLGISPLRRLRIVPRRLRKTVKLARDYRPVEMKRLLTRNGFQIARVDYLMPTFDFVGVPFLGIVERILAIGECLPIIRTFGMTIAVSCRKRIPSTETDPRSRDSR
ncbi:MAG: methyltransferase domain-containing protein [Dehalococcoidia bacterium]|nr:methyltransferase domain-containing protein [Dehalococcoidia bacterium]